MEIIITEINNDKTATIPLHLKLSSTEDIIDLLGNAFFQGAGHIYLHQNNLPDRFLELKSGIAGEILQKFSNYGIRLSITGQFNQIQSKSLHDFIRESNRNGVITFIESI